MIDENHTKTAIIDVNGKGVTYQALSERSDSIASALMKAGITPGSAVAVFQEPSSDWICSFLAVLKTGAIYLPLDLGTPTVRLAIMAADAQVCAILVHTATKDQVTAIGTGQTPIIDVSLPLETHERSVPIRAAHSDAVAVLYTSGSTGVPKGILLRHESFAQAVEASSNTYGLGSGDTILQQSALGFDMSVLQIFLALCLGGTLCLAPRSARGDPVAITKLITSQRVSFTCATPSEYLNWISYGNKEALKRSAWRVALSGGETISHHLLQSYRALGKPDLRLFNGYGPTETTCCSANIEILYHHTGASDSRISVGFPLPNESIYVLDENLQPVPVGVPGEIVIGGVGVAKGYLRDEELTEAHFVSDLFAPTEFIENGWGRMYRTGDKGRWNQDGSLSVEGRLTGDTQIKLRGLRIELREIEDAVIQGSHGALSSCVVSARADSAEEPQFLVAHVVFDPNYALSERDSFLKHLSSTLHLPQHMCPALFVPLENLPVSSSGKVDRRSVASLPVIRNARSSTDSMASSSLMFKMKETWRSVLPGTVFDHHDIGADSDFFHVGGNSSLLVRLQALIQQDFQVSIALTQLFAASTLQHMTLCIGDKAQSLKTASLDWAAETEPEASLQLSGTDKTTRMVAAQPETAIMTGATGFLGPYILQNLIEKPQIKRIHCIAVRDAQSRQRLLDNEKVTIHDGDLTMPLLGLQTETALAIFNEADVIIHNGADVSHLKTYHTLRAANVFSTKELVKLGLDHKIPIHYVSTAGVAMFTHRKTFPEISVADTPPPTDGSEGYTASKWASERYLERVNEHFGVPVTIHRPSSITRSSSLLGEDATDMELLQNLLKYSRIMKAVPNTAKLVGALDLVSVENVAAGIVGSVTGASSSSAVIPSNVQYLHQTGDLCLPISDMKSFLESETDAVFEVLAMGVWAQRAEGLGLHPAVAAAFASVESMKGEMNFPTFVKEERGH